jgi:hypothetical protein
MNLNCSYTFSTVLDKYILSLKKKPQSRLYTYSMVGEFLDCRKGGYTSDSASLLLNYQMEMCMSLYNSRKSLLLY